MSTMSTPSRIRVKRGEWTAVWSGGRLADVFHESKPGALDCFEVGAFDWQSGELSPVTRASLRARFDEWIADSGEDFTRELPYL
jgi:hypothetical protein